MSEHPHIHRGLEPVAESAAEPDLRVVLDASPAHDVGDDAVAADDAQITDWEYWDQPQSD